MDFNFKTDVDNFIKICKAYHLQLGELSELDNTYEELNRLMFLDACLCRLDGLSWSETEVKLREKFSIEEE